MQPTGEIDVDPKHVAWINGCLDDSTNLMTFWFEFWCPLGFWDSQLHVPFGHDYAGVGPEEIRSAMCPKCKHCFVVSPSDVCYARETVRRIKNLTKCVRRKVYPCKYVHTHNLCEAPECGAS